MEKSLNLLFRRWILSERHTRELDDLAMVCSSRSVLSDYRGACAGRRLNFGDNPLARGGFPLKLRRPSSVERWAGNNLELRRAWRR